MWVDPLMPFANNSEMKVEGCQLAYGSMRLSRWGGWPWQASALCHGFISSWRLKCVSVMFLFISSFIGTHSCTINRFGELTQLMIINAVCWVSYCDFYPGSKSSFHGTSLLALPGPQAMRRCIGQSWSPSKPQALGSFNFVRINMDNLDMADVEPSRKRQRVFDATSVGGHDWVLGPADKKFLG